MGDSDLEKGFYAARGPKARDSESMSVVSTLSRMGVKKFTFVDPVDDIVAPDVREMEEKRAEGYERYSAMLKFWKENGYRL